ncbi:MAG: transglutaminaseTgpA domain-containing protein [Actinomycetota bacterium]
MGSETRAHLALAGLLLATLLAFIQLFQGGAFFGPAFLAATIATAIALGARRLGVNTALTLVASSAALLWYLAVVFAGRHLFFGLPTQAAIVRVLRSVVRARELSQVDFAPIPPRTGYVVMIVAGMWLAATVAELGAFRWRRPLLASAGPIGLMSLVLVVGNDRAATLSVLLFLAALLTFWGLESSHRLRSWGRWVSPWAHHAEEPGSVTGAVARRMGGTCLAAAVIAPLLLPALDDGLLAWRTGTGIGDGLGGAGRIDLLVSLAPTLVEQSDRELFTVEAESRALWRLTSLADFDGEDWTPSEPSLEALVNGDVPAYDRLPSRFSTVTQRFTITGLRDELLPAAVQPATVDLDEAVGRSENDLSVDRGTGALRLGGGLEQGLTYTVESVVPDATYGALKDASVGDPGAAFRELPNDLSRDVYELVERWTEGWETPFEKLVAIQERLRRFTYSTDVEPEDSADYLTEFLTRTRTGYCQQFATAFAVLARSQGYPARVSVGFLAGTPDPNNTGDLIVTGRHAHAWPEIYFDDFGWVPFEPTPRADATEPIYTSPAVAGSGGVGGPSQGNPAGGDGILSNRLAGREGVGEDRLLSGRSAQDGGGLLRDPAWAKAFDRIARATIIAVLAFLVAVPLLKEWRMRRRYLRAATTSGTTIAAFTQFEGDARELFGARRASESAAAYAARVARAERAPRRVVLELAQLFEEAEYGAREPSRSQAVEARRLAGRLRGALWASASWWQRAQLLFSPASLVPRRDAARTERPLPAIAAGGAAPG